MEIDWNWCFLLLGKPLLDRFCVVGWELFSVSFQYFVLCHLVTVPVNTKKQEPITARSFPWN